MPYFPHFEIRPDSDPFAVLFVFEGPDLESSTLVYRNQIPVQKVPSINAEHEKTGTLAMRPCRRLVQDVCAADPCPECSRGKKSRLDFID